MNTVQDRKFKIGDPILEVNNISLSFGGVNAITDTSFNVLEHEVRAIIGPDGAGKSSMLNCINGIYKPQQGSIAFKGNTLSKITPNIIAPQLVEEIFNIVKELNDKEGVSILLAEQNTNIALRNADYGYIIETGQVMLDGSAKSLLNDDKVKEFYLGISSEGRKNFRDVLKETKKNKGLQS